MEGIVFIFDIYHCFIFIYVWVSKKKNYLCMENKNIVNFFELKGEFIIDNHIYNLYSIRFFRINI